MPAFEIIMVQLNTLVGDFDGNVARILERVAAAEQSSDCCVLVFPELSVAMQLIVVTPRAKKDPLGGSQLSCGFKSQKSEIVGSGYSTIAPF